MHEELKEAIRKRFPPSRYQLSHLYDFVMQELGIDGIDGENAAGKIIADLHNEQFIDVRISMFSYDTFETVWS